MDSQPNGPLVSKGEISFPNGNRAVLVKAPPTADPATLIETLKIKKPATVLLLIGGADDLDPGLNLRLLQLLDEGLGSAASNTDALIIDGGTEAGVMALMGKVVAKRGHVTGLLGIAPAGKVTYPGGPQAGSIEGGAALDPNHSHFVLVEGKEWSSGTEAMFRLAGEFAKDSRVVAVLINGGDETKEEVARCVEHGWPVLVIEGSGRLADEIAAKIRVTGKGDFEVIALQDPPEVLCRSITQHAKGALVDAWLRFAQYDSKAQLHQAKYRKLLKSTLVIGVLGTLFALSQKQLTNVANYSTSKVIALSLLVFFVPLILVTAFTAIKRWWRPDSKDLPALWWKIAVGWLAVMLVIAIALDFGTFLADFVPALGYLALGAPIMVSIGWLAVMLVIAIALDLRTFLTYFVAALGYLALGVPIVVSILLTAANRFKPRQKWVLLRGSAEAVKQEIFRYRTKTGEYGDDNLNLFSPPQEAPRGRDAILADNVSTITRRLLQTEVNTASLVYSGPLPPKDSLAKSDNGFSFLTAEKYVEVRLNDQLGYYAKKTAMLESQMGALQWSIFIVGGLGTLLAALGAQLWIALTTAVVTALSAWVGHFQLDHTLVQYNQTAGDLGNLRAWWNALSAEEKAKSENHDTLVNKSEKILGSEFSGWVQQMEDTMEDVRADAKTK
jgi:hypothetical protein